jgi:hypothetical protein
MGENFYAAIPKIRRVLTKNANLTACWLAVATLPAAQYAAGYARR